MSKQVRKYLLNILLLVAITVVALFFVLKDDAKGVIEVISTADYEQFLYGMGLEIIVVLLDGLGLYFLAHLYSKEYPYPKAILNDCIGKFFSGITPSSSGGQFAQAYTFHQQGINIANAASILIMAFIIYELSVIIFGVGTLIYCIANHALPSGGIDLWGWNLSIVTFSFIGFAINLVTITFLIFFSCNRRLHKKVVRFSVSLGCKLHIIKKSKREEKELSMNAKVETFRTEFKRLLSNFRVLLIVLFINLVRAFITHSIPYFAFTSCHVTLGTNEYFYSVAMSSLINMITQMIPIPGASGGAEYVFAKMFSSIVSSQTTINSAILLWRFMTFYFTLFLGGFIFIFYHESPKMETLHYTSKTLLEMEVIHLDDVPKETSEEHAPINNPIIEMENVADYFERLKNDFDKNLKANNRAVLKEERMRKKKNDSQKNKLEKK